MEKSRSCLLEKAIDGINAMMASGQFVPGSLMLSERELASRLDVSRATVQRAFKILKNDGKFKKLSRKGTIVASSQNTAPVSLGRSVWAVFVPTMKYFYPPIIHEIEKEARKRDIKIQLNCIGDDINAERQRIWESIDDGVSGIILAPGTPTSPVVGHSNDGRDDKYLTTALRLPGSMDYLAELPVPVVVIDHFGMDMPDIGVDCIIKDDFAGTYLSTVHMIQHGHTKIGCFAGLAPGQITQGYEFVQRRKGYEAAMADYGLSIPDFEYLSGWDIQNNHQVIRQYIDAGYDSFIFTDDVMAAYFLRLMHNWNIKVPDDVAVIGYDDEDICQTTIPPLSSVRVPKEVMAHKAIEILQDRIESKSKGNYRSIILKPSVVVRCSCGCTVSSEIGSVSVGTAHSHIKEQSCL